MVVVVQHAQQEVAERLVLVQCSQLHPLRCGREDRRHKTYRWHLFSCEQDERQA